MKKRFLLAEAVKHPLLVSAGQFVYATTFLTKDSAGEWVNEYKYAIINRRDEIF